MTLTHQHSSGESEVGVDLEYGIHVGGVIKTEQVGAKVSAQRILKQTILRIFFSIQRCLAARTVIS